MLNRHAPYRAINQQATAILRKAQDELAATYAEGRSPEWGVRRRQEIHAKVADDLRSLDRTMRETWRDQRAEHDQLRPQFPSWSERQFAALAIQQDLANLAETNDVMRYYRQTAKANSPAYRQELDRLTRQKLAGEHVGMTVFENARAEFMTPDERFFENGERELDQIGELIGTFTDWHEIGRKELATQEKTSVDPGRLYDQYTEPRQ